MKRLLLLLLIFCFPLQASWAAVAVFCQHESGQASQHFGHHPHQHQADADEHKATGQDHEQKVAQQDSTALEAKADGATLDPDCGMCMSHSLGMFLALPASLPPDLFSSTQSATGLHFSSQLRQRPERPKWQVLPLF